MRHKDTVRCTSRTLNQRMSQNLQFKTVTAGAEDDTREVLDMDIDFSTLNRKFDKYFIIKRIINKRTPFHQRQQMKGKATEEFYRSLKIVCHSVPLQGC